LNFLHIVIKAQVVVVFQIKTIKLVLQHNILNGILYILVTIIEKMKDTFMLDGLNQRIHTISIVQDIIQFHNFSFSLLKIIITHHIMVILLRLNFSSVKELIPQQ